MTRAQGMKRPLTSKQHQTGLTLVELMVSLAISLFIGLAAAAAYIGARNTATAMSNVSAINENAKLVLDMVGRELQMAGYYPAISADSSGSQKAGGFINTKNSAMAAYNQGLFGCDGARFDPTTGTCPAAVANTPDSVVINYFGVPELDSATTFSSGYDCLRQDVSLDPNNAGQIAANRPRYISNRFGLVVNNYTVQGPGNAQRAVATMSLGCNGNGKAVEDITYEPMFEGLADMVVRYGVHDGGGNLSPGRYYTATEVSALGNAGGKTGWQRVTAVHVCLLTRTLENSRTHSNAGPNRTYDDCRGNTVNYVVQDRTIFKRFERVFAIRNNINGVY
jgi:type IV pilus assembly protein PilW